MIPMRTMMAWIKFRPFPLIKKLQSWDCCLVLVYKLSFYQLESDVETVNNHGYYFIIEFKVIDSIYF